MLLLTVIGLLIATGQLLDKVVSREGKIAFSRHVNKLIDRSASHTFGNLFDRVFGLRIFSWRAIFASTILSFISLIVIFLYLRLFSPGGKIYLLDVRLDQAQIVILSLFLLLNFIGDFFSYAQTRLFIRTIYSTKDIATKSIFIVCDFFASALIYVTAMSVSLSVSFYAYSALIGQSWSQSVVDRSVILVDGWPPFTDEYQELVSTLEQRGHNVASETIQSRQALFSHGGSATPEVTTLFWRHSLTEKYGEVFTDKPPSYLVPELTRSRVASSTLERSELSIGPTIGNDIAKNHFFVSWMKGKNFEELSRELSEHKEFPLDPERPWEEQYDILTIHYYIKWSEFGADRSLWAIFRSSAAEYFGVLGKSIQYQFYHPGEKRFPEMYLDVAVNASQSTGHETNVWDWIIREEYNDIALYLPRAKLFENQFLASSLVPSLLFLLIILSSINYRLYVKLIAWGKKHISYFNKDDYLFSSYAFFVILISLVTYGFSALFALMS